MKKFSFLSFFLGGVAGIVLGGIGVAFLAAWIITQAVAGSALPGVPFGDQIVTQMDQLRKQAATAEIESRSTSLYGTLSAIGSGIGINTLQVTSSASLGSKTFTFRFDAGTEFVTFANNTELSKIPLTAKDLVVGDKVTVFANEVVGSVENQYTIRVVKN